MRARGIVRHLRGSGGILDAVGLQLRWESVVGPMAAAGPGLGAYIQAQKRQKQIEDQLTKAHDGDKDGGKKADEDRKDEKEDQTTVGALAKTVAKEVPIAWPGQHRH